MEILNFNTFNFSKNFTKLFESIQEPCQQENIILGEYNR